MSICAQNDCKKNSINVHLRRFLDFAEPFLRIKNNYCMHRRSIREGSRLTKIIDYFGCINIFNNAGPTCFLYLCLHDRNPNYQITIFDFLMLVL